MEEGCLQEAAPRLGVVPAGSFEEKFHCGADDAAADTWLPLDSAARRESNAKEMTLNGQGKSACSGKVR